MWIQTYPKDFVPHSNVANLYSNRGEFDKAAAEYRTAISLAPDEPLPYGNLAGVAISRRTSPTRRGARSTKRLRGASIR